MKVAELKRLLDTFPETYDIYVDNPTRIGGVQLSPVIRMREHEVYQYRDKTTGIVWSDIELLTDPDYVLTGQAPGVILRF